MDARLNEEPLQEEDCSKYLGLQVTAKGSCEMNLVHRMNDGYKLWEALKSMLIPIEDWM